MNGIRLLKEKSTAVTIPDSCAGYEEAIRVLPLTESDESITAGIGNDRRNRMRSGGLAMSRGILSVE